MRARPPSRPVFLTEANQQLSRLVGVAEAGTRLAITHRGRPVARLVPVSRGRTRDPEWQRVRRELEELLDRRFDLGGARLESRDEIYDRGLSGGG